MKRSTTKSVFIVLCILTVKLLCSNSMFAQGTTNAQILGTVTDAKGEPLIAASVQVKHLPSGSIYGVYTREDGRFNIPSLRVGGPYKITISYVGYKNLEEEGIFLSLGQNLRYNGQLTEEAVVLNEVLVTAKTNEIMNSERTGAATNIKREALEALPSLGRNLNDFVRLTPQSRLSSVSTTTAPGTSFLGNDSRYNNLSLDGSIFNNSFGLASTPGGQSNATPVGLDAIEEVQVNLGAYDVRLSGFTGAGVNAVTKSGSNKFTGTAYYNLRNQNFVCKKADTFNVTVLDFDVKQFGASLGGAIIKNKLFFFVNAEGERRDDPLQYRAQRAGESVGGNITRVKSSTMDSLRQFLIDKYNYDPGVYDGYALQTYSNKLLGKIDYNINNSNKLSFRYNYLRSYRDVLASGSGAAGFRNGNLNNLNFRNTNYIINNDIHSGIIELNTLFGSKASNQVQIGFTANRDYRESPGSIFPLVDIREGNITYTSFGYEPFTPNNRLNTNTIQIQDNITWYLNGHTVTAGFNFESFDFENTFTPTWYGKFTFASLNDFYKSANGESVTLPNYELGYSVLPGGQLPIDKISIKQPGIYFQDNISSLNDRLNVTFGFRLDRPHYFSGVAYRNQLAASYNFKDSDGESIQFETDVLPRSRTLFSPRMGFNYDVLGNRKLQFRGGIGVFTGRVPFVWISNQAGNNGVTKNSINSNNTTKYPFSPDVDKYVPDNPSTSPSFNLAVTDKNFKLPQLARLNIAVDYSLPWNFVASLEGIYSKTINNVAYVNANQVSPTKTLSGADNRPLFPGGNSNRLYANVSDAILLKNTSEGFSYSICPKLERQFKNGLFVMAAYNFSESKDLMTAGSIAFSSWRDQVTVNGNNLPNLSYSDFDQRHRFIAALSYKKTYLKSVSSQISIFMQSSNQSRFNLVTAGDLNNDGQSANDLMYVPNDGSEIHFKDAATEQEQRDAFMKFVNNNEELAKYKGRYYERNGGILPFLTTLDLAFVQEFGLTVGQNKNRLQIRADIYNFLNLLDPSLGVGDQLISTSPLKFESRDAANIPYYTFTKVNGKYPEKLIVKRASLTDVYQIQLGVRYIFN